MSEVNMTQDEVLDKVVKILEETTTPDNALLQSLPSNNGVAIVPDDKLGTPEEVIRNVSINPVTGEIRENTDEESEIDKELAKLLDISLDDLGAIPESINDIEIPEELIAKAAKEKGIHESQMLALIPLINEYRKKSNDDSINWYTKMPQEVQTIISAQCAEVKNYSMGTKKMLADLLLQELVQTAGIDKFTIDFQAQMKKAMDLTPVMKYNLKRQISSFETKMLENAAALRAAGKEEKALEAEAISEAYKQSYTFTKFIETAASGKLKVKKFDLSKIRRYATEFDLKYEGDTPFSITSITNILPVLYRKFEPDIEVTSDDVIRFVIAFIKYTQNMSAYNVVDHTFMSYVISNIISLDFPLSSGIDEDGNEKTERDECDVFIETLTTNLRTAILAVKKGSGAQ